MRLLVLAWSLLFFVTCTEKSSNITTLTDLELQILDSIHHHEGEFAVAFKNLDTTGETIFINKSTIFHAASTMKTPVMIEVFKQISVGNTSLDDSLIVTNKFRSMVDSSWYELGSDDDSEHGLYQSVGEKVSIGDLMEAMITESSNLANNILIDYLGAELITQTMKDLGAADMQVLRGVEDLRAYHQGLSNTTNALSLLVIYEKLANGKVVSIEASESMIEVLKRQHYNDVIPALLPDQVVVAHKTGSISHVHHDSGIVFLPDGRKYVLVLLSKDLVDFDDGTRLLQNISKMIYDYVVRIEK